MKITKIFMVLILICCGKYLLAQSSGLPESSPTLSLWFTKNKLQEKGYGTYYSLTLNVEIINNLLNNKTAAFTMEVENEGKKYFVDFIRCSFEVPKVKTNNVSYVQNLIAPLLYSGHIRGETRKNNCMVTVSKNYVAAQFIFPNSCIEVAQKISGGETNYFLANSNEFKFPAGKEFSCGTIVGNSIYQNPNAINKGSQLANSQRVTSSWDKCNTVFVDCTSDFYNQYISTDNALQQTINHVYTLWNDVYTAYSNEQMRVGISEINVWTGTPAMPFIISNRDTALKTFADYYKNNFQGNMALLLDFSTGEGTKAGLAGGFGKAKGNSPNTCGTYVTSNTILKGSYAYNDLHYIGSYQNFPIQSIAREVYSTVHELGHLFGSPHTQWCGWPGGPIDNCGTREGDCTQVPPAPVNGGTFMSYCIGDGNFVNFNNGFGPLPGATIRSFVDGNNCVSACNCVENIAIGNIVAEGYYHYEAANEIIANGTVPVTNSLIKLDGGNKVILSPGFAAPQGSKVQVYNDGCLGNR